MAPAGPREAMGYLLPDVFCQTAETQVTEEPDVAGVPLPDWREPNKEKNASGLQEVGDRLSRQFLRATVKPLRPHH